MRLTYEINEPEDFKQLLELWNNQNRFYPVFVQREYDPTPNAMFWLETEHYRAVLHVQRQTSEELLAAIATKSWLPSNNPLIEGYVYADAGEELRVLDWAHFRKLLRDESND